MLPKGFKHSEITKEKMRESHKGKKPMLGKRHSEGTKRKMRKARFLYHKTNPSSFKGKHHSEETKRKMRENHADFKGEKSPNWKGGISKNYNEYQKIRRHKLGISKKHKSEMGISYTKEYKKLHRKIYKYLSKNAGRLPIKIIQMVYEDNIKKYGTLTCYLCFNPILFGQDSLEHKQPLSRGGTNEYNNLAISCLKCNKKKHNKTEEEYRKEILSI